MAVKNRKVYRKTHQKLRALTAHASKIKNKGGKVHQDGMTLVYSYPENPDANFKKGGKVKKRK